MELARSIKGFKHASNSPHNLRAIILKTYNFELTKLTCCFALTKKFCKLYLTHDKNLKVDL